MLRTNWAPQCLKLPATIWTLPCVLVYLHLFSLQLNWHWVLVVLVKNACVIAFSWCSSSSRVNNLVCTWWELTTRRNSSSSRVPDEFSMNEKGFRGTSSLLWANEHAAPRLHWLTFLRLGFTGSRLHRLLLETLKDQLYPSKWRIEGTKACLWQSLALRRSCGSLSCLWSQQVFEPQSKNAAELVICQKRKDTTRWFHISEIF